MLDLPSLIEIRHDLHAHPQLAYEETYASGVVQRELERLGVPFEADVAQTGVVGWITRDDLDPDDAVLLRADMDALPIEEATGATYASKTPGLMHACGHDGHTTSLLGATRLLMARRDELIRPVKLLFQPAEEGGAGAKRMIEAGALTSAIGPVTVTRAYGLHGWPDLPLGQVATRPGPILAATDDFWITFTGRGGHAAVPHLAIDPLPAAAALVGQFQTLITREAPSQDSVVLSVTQLHAGSGHATNVISPTAKLGGTLRTLTPSTRQLILQRMSELAEAMASGAQLEVKFDHREGYPSLENNAQAVNDVTAVCRDIDQVVQFVPLPHAIMGGEDFAYIAQAVPSAFAFVGLQRDGDELPASLHSPGFDFNDDALPIAANLLANLALQERG